MFTVSEDKPHAAFLNIVQSRTESFRETKVTKRNMVSEAGTIVVATTTVPNKTETTQMKHSRADVRGKAKLGLDIRFESQSLTSYSGLIVFQHLFSLTDSRSSSTHRRKPSTVHEIGVTPSVRTTDPSHPAFARMTDCARESLYPRKSPVDGLIEAARDSAVRNCQAPAPAVAGRPPQRRSVSHAD